MKQNIEPAEGKLGVLIVGVGGAVATTLMAGVIAARKGKAVPVGSTTQLARIRMQDGEEHPIKELVPIARLEDIVFGGWDIFEEDAYQAAVYAEVLKAKDLENVREELQAIHPMKAAFDHNFARRLNGTHLKEAKTRWEMVEQLREDIRRFKAGSGVARLVVLWAASTEIYLPMDDVHMHLDTLEAAMRANDVDHIAPSMCYAYAALSEGVPFIMGAPNL